MSEGALSRTVKAVRGLIHKEPRKPTSEAEKLKAWLDAHPEIAEESRRGFEEIRAGRYRRLSPRDFED